MNATLLFVALMRSFLGGLVAVPFVIGMVQSSSAPQKFDVASVKLNKSTVRQPGQFKAVPASGRLTITDMLVRFVIQGAYGLQSYQLVVADKNPVLAQKVDIEAKTGRPVMSGAQLQQMLQPLLAERFKLAIHRESREMNALVLTLASDGRLGPKMKKSDQMVDQTGLKDRYDIDVTYTPTPFSAAKLAQDGRDPMPGVDPNGPSLLNAVEEQLGFKLQTKKMPIPVVVIDHIEPPTEN